MILLAKQVKGIQTKGGGVHRLSPSHSHFTIVWVCVYLGGGGQHDMYKVINGVKNIHYAHKNEHNYINYLMSSMFPSPPPVMISF